MYFSSLAGLIAMGGQGRYVWLAVAFSVFWLAYLVIHPLRKKRQLLHDIQARQLIESRRQTTRSSGE